MALLCCATSATAQVVIGELIGADNRQPLPGTLVTLVDSSGMRWARYVTNASGRFILQPNMPGRYIIRAERIGYQVAVSPLLTVTDTLLYRFVIQPLPVQLPGIEVASRERGCERHRDGTAVATLWNEIRKALNVAEWTEQAANLTYGSRVYRVGIDTEYQLLRSEEHTDYNSRSRMPFSVASAADLAMRGFSRARGDDLYLLAPDAAVLTSSEFVDTHCFRLAVDRRAPNLIGLTFEPLRERDNVVDIKGTLWVDRASSALRTLEFTYTNLPRPVSDHGARGDMRFLQLANGLWIVESWRIQGPHLVMRRVGYARPQVQSAGITEDGGIVVRALDGEALLYETPRGSSAIEGIVRKRPGGEPLADATVFLAGTAYEATSDAQGRFRIGGVPAGRYALTFTHDIVKDIRFSVPMDSVRIAADTTVHADVTLPEFVEVMRMVCPGERELDTPAGLIYGTARDSAGAPIVNADVSATWSEVVVDDKGRIEKTTERTRRGVRTDAQGRYYLCWLPLDVDLTVHLKTPTGEQTSSARLVRMTLPFIRADFP